MDQEEVRADEDAHFRLRSYQEEMYEASLRGNVVVKMDTGSGKTAIAVARADAALKGSDPTKIVWLIAPTVPLCIQHSETFKQHLPAYQIRSLLGSDGIDRWSTHSIWDAALKNIRIVISVAAVLRDALDHTFVRLDKIALLIFDEAHHCQKNHAGAVLMRDWYHKMLSEGRPVPSVLGLSASIVKPGDLELILDAKVITPSRCRTELLHHVNRPVLKYLLYRPCNSANTPKLAKLDSLQRDYDLLKDHWISKLEEHGDSRLIASETCYQKEIKALYSRAEHIFKQLGPSLADWYVETSARSIIDQIKRIPVGGYSSPWSFEESNHLTSLLQPLLSENRESADLSIGEEGRCYTPKVEELIQFLEKEWVENFTGLIFVQQRTLAYTLAHLLAQHKFKRGNFRAKGFVGTSGGMDSTKRMVERIIPKDQGTTLEKFRSPEQEVNLLVSTEVLGEGVDIPQCHLVICFDAPPRLISYVQKRGRARLKDSKYALFLDEIAEYEKIQKWQKLEKELDEAFQDAEKDWAVSRSLEEQDDPGNKEFRVPSTGALLNLDNAIPKLHHFCQTLHSGNQIDTRPQFSFESLPGQKVLALVTTPISVDPQLRTGRSSQSWYTEKKAKQDAAFGIVKRLYDAGLLNDNLLPLKAAMSASPHVENIQKKKMSLCLIQARFNPWLKAAELLSLERNFSHAFEVTIQRRETDREMIKFMIFTPVPLPRLSELILYWNKEIQLQVHGQPKSLLRPDIRDIDAEETEKIIRTIHGRRMPSEPIELLFRISEIQGDVDLTNKSHRKSRANNDDSVASEKGVVIYQDGWYLVQGYSEEIIDGATEMQAVIKASTFPKRRDFHHVIDDNSKDAYTREFTLPAAQCTPLDIDQRAATISLFIPSILRRVELALVTKHLANTLLAPVCFQNLGLLQTAITHNSACEAENYQSLEFLGDCILKYLTSVNLMVEKPLWPEGYLTEEKSRRVSNETLTATCIRVGLDKYIIHDSFTGQRWQPNYVHALMTEYGHPKDKIMVSSKMVADVVESTIGAAYKEGGIAFAVKCCAIYFPNTDWALPEQQAARLFELSSEEKANLDQLEVLIGYSFNKKSLLLEAVTSPSFRFNSTTTRSFQRLEFLGDAVLEYLVVRKLFRHDKIIPHYTMHLIRAAIVNEYILGYICMEHSIAEARENVQLVPEPNKCSTRVEILQSTEQRHIWHFLRHSSAMDTFLPSVARFEEMREEIKQALEENIRYPWDLLSRFGPSKVFSDIIESILGAIYVDSGADHNVCDQFLEHIGLYEILNRILQNEVQCMHPKELLGVVAKQRTVRYFWGEEERFMTCQIQVGGKNYGPLAKGETREATGCQAALGALAALESDESMNIEDMHLEALMDQQAELDLVDFGTGSITSRIEHEMNIVDGQNDADGYRAE